MSSAWETLEGLLYSPADATTGVSSPSVAGFDLDQTLIETASRAKYPRAPLDFRLLSWDGQLHRKLRELHERGFTLAIFSNQMGLLKGHISPDFMKERLEAVVREIGLPVYVLLASSDDGFRKPATGMWKFLCERLGGNCDYSRSFFVGDAAGRDAGWARLKKRDHSASDRQFASNLGVAFFTPDEYFLGESPAPFSWRSFEPKRLRLKSPPRPQDEAAAVPSGVVEVIVFVGFPACGKTSFFEKHLAGHGYVHVNRDKMRTPAACLRAAKAALLRRESVCVDNTSPRLEDRKVYIDLARAHGVPVRCFFFVADRPLAEHLNKFRERLSNRSVRKVPAVAFNVYAKSFTEPKVEEGFSSVVRVDFVPVFGSPKAEEAFFDFL